MSAIKPINIVIAGQDKFSTVFKNAGKQLTELSEKTEKFHKSFEKMGVGLGIGGAGLAFSTGLEDLPKMALEQEHALAKIGIQSHLSKNELKELHEEILSTSRATNQYSDVVESSAASLLKAGLAQDKVKKLLGPLGELATASDQDMGSLTKSAIALNDELNLSPAGITKALDQMLVTSKEGKVTLSDMTDNMAELLAKAKLLGMKGPDAIGQIGAALQIVAKGSNNSSEAIGNLGTLIKSFTPKLLGTALMKLNPEYAREYVGILKTSKEPIKDIAQFLDKISGGNAQKLSMLFRGTNAASVVTLIQNMKQYQNIIDKTQHAETEKQKDFNAMMQTSDELWKQFKISLVTTALPNLQGPLHLLNTVLFEANHHAWVLNGTLIAVGGTLTTGALLFGIGQFTTSLASMYKMLQLVGKGSGLAGLTTSLGLLGVVLVGIVASILVIKAGIETINAFNALQEEQDRAKNQDADLRKTLKEKYHLSDDAIDKKMDENYYKTHEKPTGPGFGFDPYAMGLTSLPTQRTEHVVTFKNLPPGTQVQSKSSGKDIHLKTELGYAFGGPG